MANKLYNFQYPRRIAEVLEPWRFHFKSEYERVVSQLEERDRELENHVNFRIAQGVLDLKTTATDVAVAVSPTETTLTALTITVQVPAHREIRLVGHLQFRNTSGAAATFTAVFRRDGTQFDLRTSGPINPATNGDLDFIVRDNPTPGSHTYTVNCSINLVGGTGNLEADSGSPAFMAVEDVGPSIL